MFSYYDFQNYLGRGGELSNLHPATEHHDQRADITGAKQPAPATEHDRRAGITGYDLRPNY